VAPWRRKFYLDCPFAKEYFSIVISLHSQAKLNNLIFNFWGIYEKDFPEAAHAIGSRGFRFSLWSLSFLS